MTSTNIFRRLWLDRYVRKRLAIPHQGSKPSRFSGFFGKFIEQPAKIIKRHYPISFCGFNEAVQNRTDIGAIFCIAEHPVLSSNHKRLNEGGFKFVIAHISIDLKVTLKVLQIIFGTDTRA